MISVVTCVISLCTGHFPATSKQFLALRLRQRAGERERRVQAIGALALRAVVALDRHGDVLDRDLLAVRVPQHRQRLARAERGIVEIVRRRPAVVAADRSASSTANACWRTWTMCRILPVRSRVIVMAIAFSQCPDSPDGCCEPCTIIA